MSLQTDVDCAGGTFMFTNVPSGPFTLTFVLPPNLNQTTGPFDLGEGETLEVEVTIDETNGAVTVVEVEREDSPSEDSESEDSESEDSGAEDLSTTTEATKRRPELRTGRPCPRRRYGLM